MGPRTPPLSPAPNRSKHESGRELGAALRYFRFVIKGGNWGIYTPRRSKGVSLICLCSPKFGSWAPSEGVQRRKSFLEVTIFLCPSSRTVYSLVLNAVGRNQLGLCFDIIHVGTFHFMVLTTKSYWKFMGLFCSTHPAT